MVRRILQSFAVYLLVLFSLVNAQDNSKLKLGFWSRMTLGQVVSSTVEPGYDIPFDREWLETIDGGIKVNYKLSPSLTGRLNLGVVLNLATVANRDKKEFESSAKKAVPALLDACLEYQARGLLNENDMLNVEVGYFPFKYNQQSTNLGEYLFRSGTYPGWLISGFEHSIDKPKLAGIHASYTIGSTFSFKQDIIMNTELDVFPYRDIHLTYIATQSLGKVLMLGSGVQLARLIALDHRKTTPGTDPFYKKNPIEHNRIGYVDTSTGDTIRYTFRGTKLMARAMFDIKELIGFGDRIFGSEDLKIYGETALLGVKNYPGWYENLKERIPIMFGFNFPAFRILDVLSIEFEYYPTPYINTQEYIWKACSPIPYVANRTARTYPDRNRDWHDSLIVNDDDIRWSIYASKQFGKHLRLSAQAACDHTPKIWYTPFPATQSTKYSDVVPKSDDWYFMMRMSIYF